MVDVTHVYLEPLTIWVSQNQFVANFCTAFTTFLVDYSLCYLFAVGIFLDKSWRTLSTVFGVLLFRQFCQFLVYFPVPVNLIWKDPGFPTFAVDYQVVTDFFYSGHTSLIVTATLVVKKESFSVHLFFLENSKRIPRTCCRNNVLPVRISNGVFVSV